MTLRRVAHLLLLLLLGASLALAAAQERVPARVVSIADGDTLTALIGGQVQVRVRLWGIDAPEDGDAYSARAKEALSGLVFGRDVQLELVDTDQYGRTVARVFVDGVDAGLDLVLRGLAWNYIQYSRGDAALAEAEDAARAARLNIWSLPNPRPPWEQRAMRALEDAARPPAAASSAQSRAAAESPTTAGVTYHGNTDSHVFHRPSCRYYSCKNCTQSFDSRDAALAAGYRPCGICKP